MDDVFKVGDVWSSDAGIGIGVSVPMGLLDELRSAVSADNTAELLADDTSGRGIGPDTPSAFVLLIAFVLLNNRAIIATFCDSEQSVRFRIN